MVDLVLKKNMQLMKIINLISSNFEKINKNLIMKTIK